MKNSHEKEGLLIEENEQDNEDNKGRKRCLQSFKGVIATFAQVLLFTASATSVQLLERRIPDLELNTFRNTVPAVLYALGILFTRKWPAVQRDKIIITFLYTVVTFLNGLFFFIAITLLPAGIVSSVVNTSCILFSLVAFSLCSNERVTPKAVLFSILCVCGVVLIIQPWTELSDGSVKVISTDLDIDNISLMAATTRTTTISAMAATPIPATSTTAASR